jgi:hypothetical protein
MSIIFYKKIVHFYVCTHGIIGLDMPRYVRKNEAKVESISFIFACFMIIVESHAAAWRDIYRNTSTLAPIVHHERDKNLVLFRSMF